MDLEKIGGYAFLLGVIIAVIAGIAASQVAAYAGTIALVLVILGLIVGLLNIKDKQVTNFLVAAIALLALSITAGGLVTIPYIGNYLVAIVGQVAVFVMPAALIVALKDIYNIASGK
ncbi:MAG: hypothetical protein HYW05_04590 [Candidatus Diapherotrites archaeon]|nr:hypothetical protein [Candidatus Diapherotrites archaeon]